MADSPIKKLKIPPDGLADLVEMTTHADKLVEIVKMAVNMGPQLHANSIISEVANRFQIPDMSARRIIDGLANLRSLMERHELSAEGLVASISASVQGAKKWKDENLDQWNAASPHVISALSAMTLDHPLLMQQKVRELAYTHQQVLLEEAIYTDLRPVFNSVADKMEAVVLTHVLAITYQDGNLPRRIEFALDLADIAKLRKSCERALLKVATTQKDLNSIRIIVVGEQDI